MEASSPSLLAPRVSWRLALVLGLLLVVSAVQPSADAQTATTAPTPVSVGLNATDVFLAVLTSTTGALEVESSGTTAAYGYPVAATCTRRVGAVPTGLACFRSTGVAPTTRLGFEGTGAQIQAALATLTFTPLDDVALSAAQVTVTINRNPDPSRALFFNPGNGHYYEFVSTNPTNSAAKPAIGDPAITWLASRDAAALKTLALTTGGTQYSGYLATITSVEEADFIEEFVDGPNVWIGASDDYTVINPALAAVLPAITAGARAGNVATISTASAHGLVAGETAAIIGFTSPYEGLNGVHLITGAPTPTTLTYANVGGEVASGSAGAPIFGYANQAASEGQFYWVTGATSLGEVGRQFWRPGSASQSKGVANGGVRVLDRFEGWKTGTEPNNTDAGGEAFAILNFSCGSTPRTCTATSNWNDFNGSNPNVRAYLVEFGPFPAGSTDTLIAIDTTFNIPDLIPAIPAAALPPVLTCTPDPVVPAGLVTCEVTDGDPGIDILWNASFNGVFAGQGVTLDDQGRGTFTFAAPRAAAGQSLSVVLVEWTSPISVGVSGQALPGSLPAGEGSGGVPALPLILALGLLGTAVWRLRGGAAIQTG